MKADHSLLRVSVATLDRVIFQHSQDRIPWLALNRKATVLKAKGNKVVVRAQPFGGGIRILDPTPLQKLVGEIIFDGERSRLEQDFRILIPPSDWEAVKRFCLLHLGYPADNYLESLPHRELLEEFRDTLNLELKPDQYTYHSAGFAVENNPVPTDNVYAQGQPTVRLYRIFEVHIVDDALSTTMLACSRHYSDQDLEILALDDFKSGGKGRLNAMLTLPLSQVMESYLTLPAVMRYQPISIENHQMDESVSAILAQVDVPQYQRF